MPNLIIVESPAKAKTLTKFLGKNYLINSTLGHTRDLPRNNLGVNISNNFQPNYKIIPEKRKVLKKIEENSKKADEIYFATDPDREGEAIAWHITESLKLKDALRIEFHEITKPAVEKALLHPRKIDINLVNAQQARRILDRLVGYKLSPLLWRKVKKGLSAGRVQSVAVRLICDREKEIEEFVSTEYWTITAKFIKDGKEFEAKLIKKDNEKINITNEQEANNILKELEGKEFRVSNIEKKDQKKNPSPPFITSTLQQEANKKFGFSAKKTMFIAQKLYEGIDLGEEERVGLITYMRTDSFNVSNLAIDEARKFIEEKYGKDYIPDVVRRYKSKKLSQEAHEAIRPTSILREPELIQKYLSKDEFKLYKIIHHRFLASCMKEAIIEQTGVDIESNNYLFRATGSKVIFPGFMKVHQEEIEEENVLPDLSVGEILNLLKLIPEQHFTQPPQRFSEASLVKTLDEKGIGRPSTYAPIIDTIQRRGYVEKENKYLKPTVLGKTVNSLLINNFAKIMDIKFTAKMEEDLDEIEEGKVDWVKILKDFYQPFSEELENAQNKIERVKIIPEVSEVICEKCGKNMVIREGRFGKFLACPGFPECKNIKSLSLGIKCPEQNCNGEVVERKSKKGRRFYVCTKYPECKFFSRTKPKVKDG